MAWLWLGLCVGNQIIFRFVFRILDRIIIVMNEYVKIFRTNVTGGRYKFLCGANGSGIKSDSRLSSQGF